MSVFRQANQSVNKFREATHLEKTGKAREFHIGQGKVGEIMVCQ